MMSRGEMTTGEDTHGCDYFTSLFLLPQLCNSTSVKTLYPPDLPSLSSKSAVTQTHFLLLNPKFFLCPFYPAWIVRL